MQVVPRFLLLSFAIALSAGIIVGSAFYVLPHNSKAGLLKAQKKDYQFKFWELTQGTNHVVYSDSPGVVKLKRALYQSPFRGIVRLAPRSLRTQWYTGSTLTDTAVLWVGLSPKDYSSGNGTPYFSKPDYHQLRCFLSEPGEDVTPLRLFTATETPLLKQLVVAWQMPQHLTNFIGWKVQLKEDGGQGDVATILLQ